MTKQLENLISLLARTSLNYHDFIHKAYQIEEITEIFDPKDLSMWKLLGLEIVKLDNTKLTLKTRQRDFIDDKFCIVDIETSGSIKSGQIIEIGAIKVNLKSKEIVDRFKTFISAPSIPPEIQELTGISLDDLKDAPPLSYVLEKFRLFLGTSIFVAHNVRFDYDYISKSMQELGFGILLNRRLCTIDLARRTIPATKYGLGSLKEQLNISGKHHRALNDAISAWEVLKVSLKQLPWYVQTTEDLITFSKTAASLKIAAVKE